MTCRYVRGCLAAFSCGPHRAPDAGCALLQVGKQGRWGIAAGSTAPPSPPLPSPLSLRTINRLHTQLRSLSARSEPQMYFMGERWL